MKRLILVLLSTILLAACQSTSTDVVGKTVTVDGRIYTRVIPDELNTMLKNKDFTFINVHIPLEGNIEDTDLSIPYNQITDPGNLARLPANKNAKIVLYCRSGRMSQIATEALVKLGYTNIWDLKGGMVDWEQAGYELDK